jgi:hypothetical protein
LRAGDIRRPSVAAAAAHGAPRLNPVPCVARWATHALVLLHGQFSIQTESGSPRSPSPAARRRGAELRRAAPPPPRARTALAARS